MKVINLNNAARETTAAPDTFIALAGEIELGKGIPGGLKIGKEYSRMKGQIGTLEPYFETVSKLSIDSNYCNFYHYSNESESKRYSNLTEAMKAYNENILSKTQDSDLASKYLLRNIPEESKDMLVGYIDGEGYRSSPESCIILNYMKSPENPDKFVALLYKGSSFAVVDGISMDSRGNLNLRSVRRPRFEIDDIQAGLNEFAIKSRTKVLYGTDEVKHKIEELPKTNNRARESSYDDAR